MYGSFGTRVLMEAVNRRAFLSLLALTFLSAVFFLLISSLIHGRDRPAIKLSEELTILIAIPDPEPSLTRKRSEGDDYERSNIKGRD
jgi:hypothetical protein